MFTGTVPTPFDQTAQAERGRALTMALDSRSEDQRAVFVMSDLEELSAPEVASVLNVNLNTVYSRLRSARREVSARLSREPEGTP